MIGYTVLGCMRTDDRGDTPWVSGCRGLVTLVVSRCAGGRACAATGMYGIDRAEGIGHGQANRAGMGSGISGASGCGNSLGRTTRAASAAATAADASAAALSAATSLRVMRLIGPDRYGTVMFGSTRCEGDAGLLLVTFVPESCTPALAIGARERRCLPDVLKLKLSRCAVSAGSVGGSRRASPAPLSASSPLISIISIEPIGCSSVQLDIDVLEFVLC